MKMLKKLSKDDLELMTYAEIAELILTEKKKQMKIVDIFKKICELLELSDSEFESRIADFFEIISTDKNFIVLDKGFCDLRKKHTPEVVIEEDDDDEETELELEEQVDEIEEEKEEDDIFYDSSSDEDDVDDDADDLTDFIVVEDEEASM